MVVVVRCLIALLVISTSFLPRFAAAQGQTVTDGIIAHVAGSISGTGSGITVGIIAPPVSQTKLLTLQAGLSPELPSVVLLSPAVSIVDDSAAQTFEGSDLGLDVMQITHDLAPDAVLVFVSPDPNAGDEADALMAAINLLDTYENSGSEVDVILDVYALSAVAEAPFYDDSLARNVDAIAGRRVYVAAAGDEGAILEGLPGSPVATYLSATVYEAPFSPAATPAAVQQSLGTDFDYIESIQVFSGTDSLLRIDQNLASLCLFWADKPGESYNDYDLFILDDQGVLVDHAAAFQFYDPTNADEQPQEPSECITDSTHLVAGNQIVVGTDAIAAEGRFIHLRGELAEVTPPQQAEARVAANPSGVFEYTTGGAVRGRAGLANVSTVGSAPVPRSQAFGVAAFKVGDAISSTTSAGSRLIFWNYSGDDYIPFDASSPNLNSPFSADDRRKPDVVGAENVLVQRVIGTPADPSLQASIVVGSPIGAAHVAGISAKLMQGGYFAAEVKDVLRATAVDVSFVPGNDTGAGQGAVNAAQAATQIALPMPPSEPTLIIGRGFATLDFSPSPDDTGFTYIANCTSSSASGVDTTVVDNVAVTPGGYSFAVVPGETVSCTVTAQQTPTQVAVASVDTGSSTVASLQDAPADVDVQPEAFGFTVTYSIDPEALAGTYNNTIACSTAGAASQDRVFVIGTEAAGAALPASPATFDDLEPDVVLDCELSIEAIIGGQAQSNASRLYTFSVTPESGPVGLPIWLLYEASKATAAPQ